MRGVFLLIGGWLVLLVFFTFVPPSEAATLKLSPETAVQTAGSVFTVVVQVNTGGTSINAAEGTITFNPKEISVVSVSRTSSIFSLWVTEPTFSNTAGTISFSGGSPTGYRGSAGTVMTITLEAKSAGAPKLTFQSGAVLANDGRGTNILSGMSGSSFTIGAVTTTPNAEVIEYVAPANTPRAPRLTSPSHSDPARWYKDKTAVLNWELPTGVTGVRTLLDRSVSSVPTKVYEEPIRTITLTDLPEGVSYFHIQFRNSAGWGDVTHYRLAVDTAPPQNFSVTALASEMGNPRQILLATATDATSRILLYKVKIDDGEYFDLVDAEATGRLTLPPLSPGYHTVIIEALDEAGNGAVTTASFTILAFPAPVFTDYPSELGENIIPVLRGTTRPSSTVSVSITRLGSTPTIYTVVSDGEGKFTVIPEGSFSTGVYEITAMAVDSSGAQSTPSPALRMAVQQPGVVRLGSLLLSVVSVIVSLLAIIVSTVVFGVYLYRLLAQLRTTVKRESKEATAILRREFAALDLLLDEAVTRLPTMKRTGRAQGAEMVLIESLRTALHEALQRVEKEVIDVEKAADGSLTIAKSAVPTKK
jgi:hypothetical protein